MDQTAEHGAPPPEPVLETLESVQVLSDSMDRMHNALKTSLGMNPSDLATLRMLVIRERQGEHVTPHDVAAHLRISTASVTALLDRLAAAGHVQRQPHPQDRRSRVLELTPLARETFFRHFGGHLRAMRHVAEGYDVDQLRLISQFIRQLAASMERPL